VLVPIVQISGRFGDASTFGAGITFARDKDRFYIVTANHVVRRGTEEASDLQIRSPALTDRPLAARLLPEFDYALDLAVISVADLKAQGVDGCTVPLDRLAEPNPAERGLEVYPLGNPNGQWVVPVRPDVVVEVKGDEISFQSAVIARGHSGGGLLDARRRLIGLIQGDAPPYGRALAMPKVLQTLKNWGLPVHLRIQSPDGEFPLFTAVGKGDAQDVKQLLGQVCTDVNARTKTYGRTALWWAVEKGRLDIVELLVNAGADVEARVRGDVDLPDGETAAYRAAKRGRTDILRFLLSHGAHDSNLTLCGANSPETVKLSLASGADPNVACRSGTSDSQPPIYGECNEETLRVLINAGANVNLRNVDGDTPLIFAVRRGLPACVKTLLEAGADVTVSNQRGDSPLSLVQDKELTVLLLKFSRRVEKEVGDSLLNLAAIQGWPDVARLLIERGIDVNAEGRGDWSVIDQKNPDTSTVVYLGPGTPLENAIKHDQIEVARTLLQSGADPDRAVAKRNKIYIHGSSAPPLTPLQLILLPLELRVVPDPATRLQWVKLLVAMRARVSFYPAAADPDSFYWEPLYLALFDLRLPDLEVAKILIANGANVNAKNPGGESLLHLAKDPEAIELLRKAGARDEPKPK
jgi:ankyrin repeat protein